MKLHPIERGPEMWPDAVHDVLPLAGALLRVSGVLQDLDHTLAGRPRDFGHEHPDSPVLWEGRREFRPSSHSYFGVPGMVRRFAWMVCLTSSALASWLSSAE